MNTSQRQIARDHANALLDRAFDESIGPRAKLSREEMLDYLATDRCYSRRNLRENHFD